ncbi:MAG: class I SAM-dependent methyltransferase family protein [Thermoplasmata archaeon]|nr:MAG: class I SAM-dependent methyltransferase family protein [Thermoplasmata archaeon]
MISHAIKVKKRDAEKVKKELIKNGLLVSTLKTKRDNEFVYFPVIKKCEYGEFIEKMEFEEKKKSYIEMAKAEGINIDSISIDFIGNIAIIKLPEHLINDKEKIARFIIKSNRNVKTVFLDKGVFDEYRVRKLEFISGENKTETIHKEYGIKIMVDVAKVYFSPRLATERMRVAKEIEEHSVTIDMFAGVAPFSLIIARYAKPEKIYAIDKNPYAIKYARINVQMNKMGDVIEVIEGDALQVIKKLPHANHIIMNLPHKSFEYLPYAIEKGDVIHYYEIIERGKEEKRVEDIIKLCRSHGYNVEIKNMHVVGSYSPAKRKIGMDLFIS